MKAVKALPEDLYNCLIIEAGLTHPQAMYSSVCLIALIFPAMQSLGLYF